ncbi:hypothetical protein H0I23_08555 [Cellulophaga sp. HaHaR_3_176]|nr:hypothetical protein [Cellulophaga sp. HaHaR_3_176]QWX82528.1 hypothetical protein H0I23_08555 [Cellulophaga sp. HaHaR_3_176]
MKFRNGIANADGIIICTLLYSPSYNNPDLAFKTEEMPGRLEFLYS